jgi:nitrate reductase beta subunit
MRTFMRATAVPVPSEASADDRTALAQRREAIAVAAGMTGEQIRRMYRLLAIAKYDERYVIPLAHVEGGGTVDPAAHLGLEELPGCSVGFGPTNAAYPGGHRPGEPVPVAIESFHLTKARASADRYSDLDREIDPAVEP